MTTRHALLLTTLLCALLPQQAFALEMDYYTYGGFEVTRDAFVRVALLFSDSNYLAYFAGFAVLGILIGGSVSAMRGLAGGGANSSLRWFVPVIVGVIVLKALVMPTGKIWVYDALSNRSQDIDDVPDIIVLVAGMLNKVERGIVAVVDSTSAYPYGEEAGGIRFELLHNVTTQITDLQDTYVTKTLSAYFIECGMMSLNTPGLEGDLNDLKRNTYQLLAELEKYGTDNNFSLWYDAVNKNGLSATCGDIWYGDAGAGIPNGLGTKLSTAGTAYNSAVKAICAKSNIDPESADALAKCQELIARGHELAGAAPGVYNWQEFLANAYIATIIDRSIADSDPDLAQKAIANRNLLVQGVGMANTANEWLPQIRAVVLALVLSMIPLMVLFIVTPLMGQALLLMVSLLAWVTLWGVSDAITHQMAMDQSIAYMTKIAYSKEGLESMFMFPEATLKSLAIFGKIRSMGIMVATVLSGALFKFGGHAIANVAQSMSSHVEHAGSQAAMQASTFEGRASTLDAMANARATHAAYGQGGFEAMAGAATFNRLNHQQAANTTTSALGGNPSTAGVRVGTLSGGNTSGGVLGQEAIANELRITPTELTRNVAQAEAAQRTGDGVKLGDAQKAMGHGDQEKGALALAYVVAQTRLAGARNAGEKVSLYQEQYSKQNPGKPPLTEEQAYLGLARFESASERGTIMAGASPENMAAFYRDTKTLDLGKMDGITDTLQNTGASIKDYAHAKGVMEGLDGVGQKNALDKMTDKEMAGLVAYSQAQAMRHGASGSYWSDLVKENGGNEGATMRMIAEKHGASEFVAANNLRTTMEVLQKDNAVATESSIQGANQRLSFSADEAPAVLKYLERNGVEVAPETQSLVRQVGGTMSLGWDSEMKVNYAHVTSGVSATNDNTTSEAAGLTVKKENHVTAPSLLTFNSDDYAKLYHWGKTGTAEEQVQKFNDLVNGVSDLYSKYADGNVQHYNGSTETSGFNLHGGVNTRGLNDALAKLGPVGAALSSVDAGASRTYEKNTTGTDSSTVNTPILHAHMARTIDIIRNWADETAAQSTSDPVAQKTMAAQLYGDAMYDLTHGGFTQLQRDAAEKSRETPNTNQFLADATEPPPNGTIKRVP